jgi:hypothetical protein
VTRSPRLFGAVAASALAAVLALTLSGCGAREAGAAATVGDRRIPVSDVQSAYQDIVQLVGPDQGITQTQILNLLILEPYLTDAAAALGRGVSDQDARMDVKAAGKPQDAAQMSKAAIEVWRATMANSALQSTDRPRADIDATWAGIGKQLKAAGVHVNPRYGAGIEYKTYTVVPEKRDWLATPAPTAQPTPGPTPTQ